MISFEFSPISNELFYQQQLLSKSEILRDATLILKEQCVILTNL